MMTLQAVAVATEMVLLLHLQAVVATRWLNQNQSLKL
jgi:hypothetical protein